MSCMQIVVYTDNIPQSLHQEKKTTQYDKTDGQQQPLQCEYSPKQEKKRKQVNTRFSQHRGYIKQKMITHFNNYMASEQSVISKDVTVTNLAIMSYMAGTHY